MAIYVDERIDLKDEKEILTDILSEPIKIVKILDRRRYEDSKSFGKYNLWLSNKWIQSEDFNTYIFRWTSFRNYFKGDKPVYATLFWIEFFNDLYPQKINCAHYCKLHKRLYNMANYGINSHELTLVSFNPTTNSEA